MIERRYHPQATKAIPAILRRPRSSSSRSGVRSFHATLSTDALLADGKSILASAWDLGDFGRRGGPLLAEHGATSLPPLGFVSNVRAEGSRLVGDVHLLPEGVHPVADVYAALHESGGRPNLSVGFRTRSSRGPTREESLRPGWLRAQIVTAATLAEVSLVAVGMDPAAGIESAITPRSAPPSDPYESLFSDLDDDALLAALGLFPSKATR